MKILIMGLSGSGKSTLAAALKARVPSIIWVNADEQRSLYNDWDFSTEGRIRQATRILDIANNNKTSIVVADFIAALSSQRTIFNPDITIWMNTVSYCKYEDTNKAFVPPVNADIRFDSFESIDVTIVVDFINTMWKITKNSNLE